MYEPSGVEHAPLLQHVASASLTVVAGGLWPGRRKPIEATDREARTKVSCEIVDDVDSEYDVLQSLMSTNLSYVSSCGECGNQAELLTCPCPINLAYEVELLIYPSCNYGLEHSSWQGSSQE